MEFLNLKTDWKADKMKRYGKILSIAAGMLIIGGIVFCQFVYGQKKISAEEIKTQFAYEEGNMVPVYNLEQEQKLYFDFELDYKYVDYFDIYIWDLVTIHTDASCSKESEIVCYTWATEQEGKTRLCVAPVQPVLANDSLNEEDFSNVNTNSQAETLMNYKTLWGCAPIYYICIHYDMEEASPVELENPQIIPFTVASESEVPDVEGIIDDYGNLKLSWEPVEGAEYYTVYQYVRSGTWSGYSNEAARGMESGYSNGSFWSLERTKETSFSDFLGTGRDIEEYEDDQDNNVGYIGKELSRQSFQNLGAYGCFFVTATVDGEESNLSAPVDTADLMLPYGFAGNGIDLERYSSVEELPEKVAVINIDGSIMQRPVYYRLNKKDSCFAFYDFQVKGTLLGGTVYLDIEEDAELPAVINHNMNTVYLNMNSQLNKVPSMAVKSILAQEGTADGTSNLYQMVKSQTIEWMDEGDKETVKKPDERYAIFADNAEEVWLTYNLMAGNEEISLKAFPKLQNPYTLEEVFLKVCQQNPYILGVCSYSYDYDNVFLRVGYSYSSQEISRKQKKIYRRAAALVKKLIKEEMTDEEKEMQLYLWLEENCSYASVELELVKKQNFLKSEENAYMENALNAYGALVEGQALCQGYASAFQLLSHMSGLHVKTVSGYLNGNIPHAWNMIELEGNWYQVDCSSNKNTVTVPFYLYNGDLEFAENNGYILGNEFISDEEREVLEKKNKDDSKEYYNDHRLTAAVIKDVEKILEKKVHQEIIAFRYTGDDLDEEELIQIVRKVFLMNGEDERLAGLKYSRINGYVVIYD